MMTEPSSKEPIGLLAGWGRFPFVIAEKARAAGIPVVCVALRGAASPDLIPLVDRFHWTRLGGMGRTIRLLVREGVKRFTMAGKLHKVQLLHPWRWLYALPDLRTIRFWYHHTRRDNRDDSLLMSVIDEFAKDGLSCEAPTDLCPELLVRAGLLTKREPNTRELADIDFGWELAKEMGRLDVGQSVAIREKAVLAVEAIEGTDLAIQRAGELCRKNGFVVVKVAKPQQDMRFDVPTIGTKTIETMYRAGGKVLAIEANKTIILDEEETIRLADHYGIAIVAR